MNQLQPQGFASQEAYLEARLGLLAMRLSLEVTRLRALRADGRRENFAGVLMKDEDISALCAELLGDGLPDMADAETHLAVAQAQFSAQLDATLELPMLERLFALYGLSAAEQVLTVLAMAPALDPRFGRVYGFLQEDMSQQSLTLALAQRLAIDTAGGGLNDLRQALSSDGTLIRYGVLQVEGSGALVRRAIVMPDDVVALLLPAPRVPETVTVLPLSGPDETPRHPQLITSPKGVAPLLAGSFDGPLWLCPRKAISVQQAREAGLCASLFGASIVFSGWDDASPEERGDFARSLGRHASVVTARPALWEETSTVWTPVEAALPTYAERLSFWQQIANPDLAEVLAREATLEASTLVLLADKAAYDATPTARLKYFISRKNSEPMHGLAERMDTPFSFDDIVLPSRMKSQLAQFATQHQTSAQVLEDWGLGAVLGASRGGIALFTGPSGVGKTMSAGIVARMAELELWRINLATVVSKYIGETERNLERIFEASAKSDVMLFFDEADALFSKRAEVKDARDRYANMEMAYLLQRLESFTGMAVLASNMSASLEPALLRRFDLVLEFDMPDADARRAIWGKLEQASAPLARDVDLTLIAERFELAGGHIRQAILLAAHQAAQGGTPIGQEHLLRAVAREMTKLGKPLRREAFGEAFAQVRGGA